MNDNKNDNLASVQSIYAAFGRGDVPAILEHLGEDVAWDYGLADQGIPWLVERKGRAGVVAFFQSLAGFQIQKFDVKAIVGKADLVLALVEVEGIVASTGRRVSDPAEVHVWHFDERGKVRRFRHAVDTLQHYKALGF
jgi:ketosteroid isomerase-like protein